MKDTLGMIPQVFYDLLGRVVPGTAVLILAIVLLVEGAQVRTVASIVGDLSTAGVGFVFLVGLVAAYVVGFLMGAIGSLFEDGFKQPLFSEIRKTPPGVDVEEADIPYIYDFILLRNAAAGARLAKLRAESHMCRGLVVGLAALFVGHLVVHWNSMHTWTTASFSPHWSSVRSLRSAFSDTSERVRGDSS